MKRGHGIHHTEAYPDNDTETILGIKQNLEFVFKRVNETDQTLLQLKVTLDRECDYALHVIKDTIHARTKRSGGVFGILKDFLFGGSEIDEQLALLKATEDQKITHVSEELTQAKKKHDKLTKELTGKIENVNKRSRPATRAILREQKECSFKVHTRNNNARQYPNTGNNE